MTFFAGQRIIAATLNDLLTKGLILSIANNTTARQSTTTETVGSTVTWTATTAATYRIFWTGTCQSSVLGDVARLRIRYLAGATLTSSGTSIRVSTAKAETANASSPFVLVAEVTGISGQYTAGGTVARVAGTGIYQVNGSSTDEEYVSVERVS